MMRDNNAGEEKNAAVLENPPLDNGNRAQKLLKCAHTRKVNIFHFKAMKFHENIFACDSRQFSLISFHFWQTKTLEISYRS